MSRLNIIVKCLMFYFIYQVIISENIGKLCFIRRVGLTRRQNKHMRTSINGQGGTTKIRSQGNLFYQPGIKLKNTPKTHQKCTDTRAG
jgi:hypothetical protein